MNVTLLVVLIVVAILVVVYPYQGKFKRMQFVIAFVLVLGVSMGYWQWGAWSSLSQYTRTQMALKSFKNPEDVIEKLKQHLKADPSSARGWFLLGRLYASEDQWPEASDAFGRAHLLEPDDEQTTVNTAQSLWQTNHQRFNASIRTMFQSILNHNPNQPDALSMLAVDAFQHHDLPKAKAYWVHLLSLVPPDSADAKAIRKAIAHCQVS